MVNHGMVSFVSDARNGKNIAKNAVNSLSNLDFLPGPWAWNQFLRGHSFDFLGASGNAEVTESPLYGKHDNVFAKNYQ